MLPCAEVLHQPASCRKGKRTAVSFKAQLHQQLLCASALQSFSSCTDTNSPALPDAGTEVAKNVNKNNAQHAIVFEAVALALALEADPELLVAAVGLLGKFISVREPNIKYLGLENLVRLAEVPAVADVLARCDALQYAMLVCLAARQLAETACVVSLQRGVLAPLSCTLPSLQR